MASAPSGGTGGLERGLERVGITVPDRITQAAAAAAATATTSNKAQRETTAHQEIPERIYDVKAKPLKTYNRGRFLGKGGFARCYEVINASDQTISACKIVNKTLLVKPHQREKMVQEITIHRGLRHEFIVSFHSYFEDDNNVYIMLELCGKKSLMELQKRRRVITEIEARFFMRQICQAVQYLHDEKKIIHRDLKLGNIFISDDMTLKIGDFGLATVIEFDGERKRTLCGTPNYIAPEILSKKGHSYEVDIWSIGCIMYTLLVGKPPFETATLRDTYSKIRRGDYYIPPSVKIGVSAKNLVTKLLQVTPTLRPTASQILQSEFMVNGLTPATLPASILTMAPRFDSKQYHTGRAAPAAATASALVAKPKPLTESNQRTAPPAPRGPSINVPSIPRELNSSMEGLGELSSTDILELMRTLRSQLQTVIANNPTATSNDDECEDPSLCPMLWVCKWVDYSDKYGFGYQLSDDSIGVSFNDQTKIVLLADGKNMHYIDKQGHETYHQLDNYPDEVNLQKKVKLLNYFQQYMKENLLKASGGKAPPDPNCIARLPNLWTWFRTSRAVVMVLSNGTLQINNFRDHSKMILCPLLGALSTLGSNKSLRTFKLTSMSGGISKDMLERLKYALEKTDVIIGNPNNSNNIRPTMIFSPGKKKIPSATMTFWPKKKT